MEILTVISMLALLQVIAFSMLVGRARGLYDVKAPAVTGNEMFERYYRVHYNTLEQIILLLPGLWAFGFFIGQYWAAGLGAIYLVGRVLYAVTYIKDPSTRVLGTLLSMLPVWILVIGGLIGALVSWLSL